jgi:hypothetical protein
LWVGVRKPQDIGISATIPRDKRHWRFRSGPQAQRICLAQKILGGVDVRQHTKVMGANPENHGLVAVHDFEWRADAEG